MKLKFDGINYTTQSTSAKKETKGIGYNNVAAFRSLRMGRNSFDNSAFAENVVFDGKKFFHHPGKRTKK